MRLRLVFAAIFYSLSMSAQAQTYDSFMINWFRSPTVNDFPSCVPSHYNPFETEALFRRAGTLKNYTVTPRREGKVYIFVEKVLKKSGEIVFFESVSDYDWCVSHYQREYWKNMAEVARDAPRTKSASQAMPKRQLQTLASPIASHKIATLGVTDKFSAGCQEPTENALQQPSCRLELLRRSRIALNKALAEKQTSSSPSHRPDFETLEQKWESLQEEECGSYLDEARSEACETQSNVAHTQILTEFY